MLFTQVLLRRRTYSTASNETRRGKKKQAPMSNPVVQKIVLRDAHKVNACFERKTNERLQRKERRTSGCKDAITCRPREGSAHAALDSISFGHCAPRRSVLLHCEHERAKVIEETVFGKGDNTIQQPWPTPSIVAVRSDPISPLKSHIFRQSTLGSGEVHAVHEKLCVVFEAETVL